MSKQFKDLRKKMSKEAKAEAHQSALEMLQQLALAELRQAQHLSQEELAKVLNIQQPAVAKIEKKVDMHISTLKRFIEALGGELEIKALFPDREVRITQFDESEARKLNPFTV